MSGTEISALFTLLAIGAACLLFLLAVALRAARSLLRIERLLATREAAATPAAAAAAATTARGGEFEAFLTEDPARQLLPKREQFSAYRRWRQEKGLNWSKP